MTDLACEYARSVATAGSSRARKLRLLVSYMNASYWRLDPRDRYALLAVRLRVELYAKLLSSN